jgi:hypothetical protein
MPELGIVDGIADIAVSKAVDDATTAADAASADLMNEYSAVLGASAYKEGASDAVRWYSVPGEDAAEGARRSTILRKHSRTWRCSNTARSSTTLRRSS